ncbi:glycoside hydrolase family 3 protein [Selenomonas ruminantium]|uniref:beta-N-acetylhexosaminidase n=1 Tax=Selenomonas ruminantium TaxID=971 RepID=A0A1H0NE02_SELRU|nr:glycoside hydrolase family 3 N-terminal domain-containing protein [Selenomonas ruminantium]SDO90873.1 beta-N-acetylhexosaminidase [Selenomonas ruminantium]
MTQKINLKAKPFNLTDEDVRWVEETLAQMTVKEKIGQLFCPIAPGPDKEALQEVLDTLQPGGMMFRALPGEEIQEAQRFLQEKSPVPLLLAANLEAGGNGVMTEGTYFGYPMAMAATGEDVHAYHLGKVSAAEGKVTGCNWAFSPIVDRNVNYLNPITNVRTYGDDTDTVIRMSKAFTRGVQEEGMAVAIKHFPGDGMDYRDQHLHPTINSCSVEEWDATYGEIYRQLIAEGAESVMVGHILQPAWQMALNPELELADLLPATLSPELLQGLLREHLGFNGLIITDATPMGGFTNAMSRREAVPRAIAAGCDMFLFNRNMEEDFKFMEAGLENGILTEARLDEAVTRILALKAHLQLPAKQQAGTLVAGKEAIAEVLSRQEFKAWVDEAADKAVTLVKDTQQALPLNPAKQKRLLLYVFGDEWGYFGNGSAKLFRKLLEEAGFSVDVFDKEALRFAYIDIKREDIIKQYDAIIYYANIEPASNKSTLRMEWNWPMASNMPWFIYDLPVIGVAVGSPYILQDIPALKTLVNGYTASPSMLQAIVKKLTGQSEFKGHSPIDPFCGMWQTKF